MTLAAKIIKSEEGFRPKPYYCTESFPTIGYGRVIGPKDGPLPDIAADEKDESARLEQTIARIETKEISDLIVNLDTVRKAVLTSMAYQLGPSGLRKFKFFLAALKEQNWDLAADHMLDSRWAKQTPKRANRHADMMRTGELLENYK